MLETSDFMGEISDTNTIIEKKTYVTPFKGKDSERCMRLIGDMLSRDEKVILAIRQSYLSSITPDRIIATNKRVIIVRPSFWGIYFGRNILSPTEFSIVPYKNIISVVISKGKLLSTLNMRIHGFTDASTAIRNEGVISGIRTGKASEFTNFIEEVIENHRISGNQESAMMESVGHPIILRESVEGNISDSEIGIDEARLIISSSDKKLVWLGLEPIEYVSFLTGVQETDIIKMDPNEIMGLEKAELRNLDGYVFMAYSGIIAWHVARFLKENGVRAYSISGGILNTLKKR